MKQLNCSHDKLAKCEAYGKFTAKNTKFTIQLAKSTHQIAKYTVKIVKCPGEKKKIFKLKYVQLKW